MKYQNRRYRCNIKNEQIDEISKNEQIDEI